MVLFETDRLALRSFVATDWKHLFEMDNDPDVMRYINGGTSTTEQTVKTILLPTFLEYDPDKVGLGFWAAIEKDTNTFLGWFCLRLSDGSSAQARIGYRFYKSTWGKGYATEGAKELLNWGFTKLNLDYIVATTYEFNDASRRVMEKIGLTKIREFPVDLSNQETVHFEKNVVWEGNDVEYGLAKERWLVRDETNNADGKSLRGFAAP